MARLLVVFLKILKVKEEASKVLRKNGETRCWQYFGENLRRWLSRSQFILLQIDGLQLTATNIIWIITWERDAKRGTSKESMIESYEMMNSVFEWFNTIEMKKFVVRGMFLQKMISPIEWQNRNIFDTNKLVDLSQEVCRPRTIEKSFWLQPSVVYIKPFTPRIWRTKTQAYALLDVSGRQPSSSCSSTWWQWSGSWLSPQNSKKVNERGCMQRLW